MRALMILALVLAQCCAWAQTTVPAGAGRYRHVLTLEARQVWGLGAPVATFAAQIHQESGWDASAVSHAGARGMAQFMPGTEAWIQRAIPALASNDGALNPVWSIRALVNYDRWLWDRIRASDDCQRMAKTLSAYNGGLTWLQRDERLAQSAPGKGPGSAEASMRWFDGVERFNSGRSAAAWRENRAYPRVILRVREPIYRDAGWGVGSC